MTMAVGSTFGAFVRYLFGRWLPTFDQLMHSKVNCFGIPTESGYRASVILPELVCPYGTVPSLSMLLCRWPWPTLVCLDS